jgi:nucleoid DNA-binding protein
MNKVLLMVLSGALSVGISFNAIAMNQAELADSMARSAEMKTEKAAMFNNDFERIVKQRTNEGKSVKITGLGSFSKGESTTSMVKNMAYRPGNGKQEFVESTRWHKVKTTGSVSKSMLVNELASTGRYTKAEAGRLLDSKIGATKSVMYKGGSLSDTGGLGSISMVRVAGRSGVTPTGTTYSAPAAYEPRFNPSSASPGLKFTPAHSFKTFRSSRK